MTKIIENSFVSLMVWGKRYLRHNCLFLVFFCPFLPIWHKIIYPILLQPYLRGAHVSNFRSAWNSRCYPNCNYHEIDNNNDKKNLWQTARKCQMISYLRPYWWQFKSYLRWKSLHISVFSLSFPVWLDCKIVNTSFLSHPSKIWRFTDAQPRTLF